MIFVTVGTHNKGFDRLIQKMDEIAANSDESVIMQTGTATYEPKHAEHFKFCTSQQIEALVKEARVVVSHAGAACIIIALRYGKPAIVVPRLKEYGEHIDDHQLELASAMAKDNRIKTIYNLNELGEALKDVTVVTGSARAQNNRSRLVVALRRYLKEFDSSKK